MGTSGLAVPLTDDICAYLATVIVHDLGYASRFPELPREVPGLFSPGPPSDLRLHGVDFLKILERLVAIEPDAITYFSCLAALHKARLKYARILESQAVPTMNQVGPRGLLQFGQMSPRALAGFMLWRKWLFDIDNRAGQETGYLFEPIIAHSIGGVPASAQKSPVRRHDNKGKGRQVDCIKGKRAYEIKIRKTIASSGQGRWPEELNFAKDCRTSGFRPVLVVFDPTGNKKLAALKKAFESEGGEVFIGDDAWAHLKKAAGKTMAKFVELYVRAPMTAILQEVTLGKLPDVQLSMDEEALRISVAGEEVVVYRAVTKEGSDEGRDELPSDVEDEL